MHGHRAHCPFGEILPFDAEGVVETGAVVFPGNRGGQFHQLRIGESLAQTSEKCIGNFHWELAHCIGVLEHQPLLLRKVEVCAIPIQVCDLFGGDSMLSADGRADINSKRAANQRGHA